MFHPPYGWTTTAGLVAGMLLGNPNALFLAGFAGFFSFLFWQRLRVHRSFLILGLAVVAGTFRAPSPEVRVAPGKASVHGTLESWQSTGAGVRGKLLVSRWGEQRFTPPQSVRFFGGDDWPEEPRGSALTFKARVYPPWHGRNPGAVERPPAFYASGPPEWEPGTAMFWHRRQGEVRRACERVFSGVTARFAQAILLGQGSALYPEERRVFRQTGTSHLVAVSGLHIGMAALLGGLLGSSLGLRGKALGAVAFALSYALMAGGSASATRAATMVSFAALGVLMGRARPGKQWVGIVLPWLVFSQPNLLNSIGFHLSLGAVLGILYFLDQHERARSKWLGGLSVSLGAQLGTLPTQVNIFGEVSALATLPNLIAVPLTGILFPSFLLALSFPEESFFSRSSDLLCRSLFYLLHWFSVWLPHLTHLPKPSPWALCGFWSWLLLWFCWAPRGKRFVRLHRAVLFCFVLLLFVPKPSPEGPWFVFLDVDQGDASVLRLSDGSTWVVDTGDTRGPGDMASNVLLPFLRDQGIHSLDGVIISHFDQDHSGSLEPLCRSLLPEKVFVPWAPKPPFVPLAGPLYVRVAKGDTLHQGEDCEIVALHPPRDVPDSIQDDRNELSLVLWVRDGPLRLLFTGDIEEKGEAILGNHLAEVDVLKVAHHGSKTSSTEPVLEEVGTPLAVISCGRNNRYGHPHPSVVEALTKRGMRILRTDESGAVMVSLNGGKMVVETMRERAGDSFP